MVGERCGRHLGLIWRAVAMLKRKGRVDKVEVARRCCAGAEAWQWEPTNEVSRDFAEGQRRPATLLSSSSSLTSAACLTEDDLMTCLCGQILQPAVCGLKKLLRAGPNSHGKLSLRLAAWIVPGSIPERIDDTLDQLVSSYMTCSHCTALLVVFVFTVLWNTSHTTRECTQLWSLLHFRVTRARRGTIISSTDASSSSSSSHMDTRL